MQERNVMIKDISKSYDYGFTLNNVCNIYGACDIEVFFVLSLAYTFNFDRYNYFYPFTFHSSNTQKIIVLNIWSTDIDVSHLLLTADLFT